MTDYRKVDEALAAGRVWRAKEILQGRLRHSPYDQDLYRRYGEVLLEMKDLPEAGRYLFLSGVRDSVYTEAIQAFLERHGRSAASLHDAFPSCMKGPGVSNVPACLWEEVGQRGIDSDGLKASLSRNRMSAPVAKGTFGERAIKVGIGVLFAIFLIGLLIQSMRGLAWLGDKVGLY